MRKSFRYMSLGGALHALVGYGVGPFVPAMFARIHHLGTKEIGSALLPRASESAGGAG